MTTLALLNDFSFISIVYVCMYVCILMSSLLKLNRDYHTQKTVSLKSGYYM